MDVIGVCLPHDPETELPVVGDILLRLRVEENPPRIGAAAGKFLGRGDEGLAEPLSLMG